jgi:hypothetical protein
MFLLFHLCTGLLLGLFVAGSVHDRRTIGICTVAAVLSDLVDKPLGHLFFPALFGTGRIFFHTLLVFALVWLVGMVLLLRYRNPVGLYVAAGIGIHQFFDVMWREPVNWLWPVRGWFSPVSYDNYFLSAIWGELTSPTEWIALFAIAIVFLAWSPRLRRLAPRAAAAVPRLLLIYLPVALAFLSLWLIALGVVGRAPHVIGLDYRIDNLLFAGAGLAGAFLLALRGRGYSTGGLLVWLRGEQRKPNA